MKKILFLGFILLVSMPIAVANANVENIQKQWTTLSKQRQKLSIKLEKVMQENADAQVKIESNKDRPKSLAYKNAVKKVESTQQKINKYTEQIQNIDQNLANLQKVSTPQPIEKPINSSVIGSYEEEIKTVNKDVTYSLDKDSKKNDSDIRSDTSSSSNVSTNSNSNDKSAETDKGDETSGWILLSIGILYAIYKISRKIEWCRCPKCKKKWALKVIDEQDLGTIKKEEVKKQDGTHMWVYYHKIKVTRECKYCGYQISHTEGRKEA